MSDSTDEFEGGTRFIEQRKAQRYPLDAPVYVKTLAGNVAEFQAQDISLHGMRFVGLAENAIPDDAELTVVLPDGVQFDTTARLIWCVKNEVYGVEFGVEALAAGSPLPQYISALGG